MAGIPIDDAALTPDGLVDVLKIRPIARLGYDDYTTVDSVFRRVIPGGNAALLAGLEGSADQAQAAAAAPVRAPGEPG